MKKKQRKPRTQKYKSVFPGTTAMFTETPEKKKFLARRGRY